VKWTRLNTLIITNIYHYETGVWNLYTFSVAPSDRYLYLCCIWQHGFSLVMFRHLWFVNILSLTSCSSIQHHDLKLLKYTYTFIKSALSFHYPLWWQRFKRNPVPSENSKKNHRSPVKKIAGQENCRSPTFEFDRRQTVSPFQFFLLIDIVSSVLLAHQKDESTSRKSCVISKNDLIKRF